MVAMPLPGEPEMKTIRETLIEEGRSADEIEALAEAFADMGDSIDTAPKTQNNTQRSQAEIGQTLWVLNCHKRINY